MPTTGTGFKKLEEKVAAGKPLTFTEQNIVNRASGVPTVKPTTVPVAPPPVAPVTSTPLFKTVNPIQDKLDAAAQERERQQNQAVLSNPSAYSLEAVNKANAWQSGQQPGKTISQQAESQMMGEFKTNFDEALKRGITLPYKTFEEYKAWKQQPIDQATSYTQQQQDLARMSEGLKFEKARTDIEAAKAGNVAALAQGREGVQSVGNVMARSQFAAEMERQKQQMNIERQSAEAQRVKAMADLKRAREEGDVSLANAIQGQISQIESNLRQIDTQALQAATQASAEARAVEAQKMNNLNTFKGFLTEGIEMPASAISSFADMSGLDSGMLAQAYLGAQSIRTDKNLSREEKQAKLADLQIDLDRKQKGLDDEALRATATLQAMYKRGASAQEIADFKSAAKITDQNDPVYQAELKYKQAQIEAAKTGSTLDRARAAQLFKELQDANGNSTSYIPNGTTFNITTTANGIVVGAKDGTEGGQCGRFVNNVFGVASFFGDSYEDKKKKIDSLMPAPGMAFVMPAYGKYSPNGHVGIVESVNADGSFNIVDSNRAAPNTIGRKTLTINDVDGFVKPPNATQIGGKDTASVLMQVPKELRSSVTQKANQFDSEQQVKTFQTIQTMKNKADSVSDKTENPQDDQLLVYTFAKAMDPTSAVREGEYDTIQGFAQTALQRFGVNAERFYSNAPFLTTEARQNIKKSIAKAYQAEEESYNNVRQGYIKALDSMAGKNVGESLLQDYKIMPSDSTQDSSDPLGLGFKPQSDPLNLYK